MELTTEGSDFSAPVKLFARIVSLVFHPLLSGVYVMAWLVFVHPGYFLAYNEKMKMLRFVTFANNNFLLPMLVVFLMRGLGFNKSIYLRTQKERIGPYVACIVFFFWTWYIFRNLPDTPQAVVDFCQAMFMSVCVALILNNFFKISMHTIAMGGILALMINMIFAGEAFSAWPVIITVMVTALVCSSRKIASDHSWMEIVSGLFLGFLMQCIAWWK